jgi:hypothetical protein
MFDRTTLAFVIKDKIQLLPISQVVYAFDNCFLNPDTIYFNNLVQTMDALRNNWIIHIKHSWLKKRFDLKVEN